MRLKHVGVTIITCGLIEEKLNCLVPRLPHFVAVEPFRVTWSERKNTSSKWIDCEGLGKSRTGIRQPYNNSANMPPSMASYFYRKATLLRSVYACRSKGLNALEILSS